MLRSVFPRAHQKYFSLPLLGPITDGFDDRPMRNVDCRVQPGEQCPAEFVVRVVTQTRLTFRRADEIAEQHRNRRRTACSPTDVRHPTILVESPPIRLPRSDQAGRRCRP